MTNNKWYLLNLLTVFWNVFYFQKTFAIQYSNFFRQDLQSSLGVFFYWFFFVSSKKEKKWNFSKHQWQVASPGGRYLSTFQSDVLKILRVMGVGGPTIWASGGAPFFSTALLRGNLLIGYMYTVIVSFLSQTFILFRILFSINCE